MPLQPIHISTITDQDVLTYGNVSNDMNPLHFDEDVAKSLGFSNRIVHGMLSMGFCLKLLHPWLSDGAFVTNMKATFHSPLLVGDSLTITGESVHNVIYFNGVNSVNVKVISGEMTVQERK
ncbi:MaoC family dehydratase [Bacillus alkalicellulosilyticus]|uniref:MaoC family dehydratase n=1 Tax=Alkalihalobacterium alkalicellulosilyticum TaxID=1912214 RepID=UPI001FEB5C38|nr:MaoC family dehydratase [Bacillus alkalicellulosilyticus]